MEINDKIGMREVFCRYIRRNGKIIYPKNARFFHFWVPAEKSEIVRYEQLSMFVEINI